MTHKCDKEQIIVVIMSDLKEVKTDVKSLLKFKYQILGVLSFLSAIISLTFNYIFTFFRGNT